MPNQENNPIETNDRDFANLPENNPGPVFQIFKDGTILLANKVARSLFADDQLAGKNWLETCPGFDRTAWETVLTSEKPSKVEIQIGDLIFLFTFVRPDMGDFIYAYGNDVTQFRHVQYMMAEQTALLKEMARFPEMNPGPVFRMDRSGNIILANAAARKILGEQIAGDNWLNIFPGITEDIWAQILDSSDVLPLETRIGECDYVFTHRSDPETQLVFVYGSDITYQKKTERALMQAEKMATLGTLAAGVAHELNNPAAATKRAAEHLREAINSLGSAHHLLTSTVFPAEARAAIEAIEQIALEKSKQVNQLDPLTQADRESEMEEWLDAQNIPEPWDLAPYLVALDIDPSRLEQLIRVFDVKLRPAALKWMAGIHLVYILLNEINQGSGRISEIVGALKNYSYLGQAPIQMVDIHEGLDNTLIILRNKMKKGVTIFREYGEGVPEIFAYGSELNQVWTNLLDNAVDAMGGQGEIWIRTRREKGFVVVEIEDNGPGIPKAIQSRIFDPFFTTKEPGKGTGLGLSTTYGIVTEKHKGSISVYSHPGMTRFIVKLPIDKLQYA